ncbi:hypothetical protein CK203_002922 [Vitis vinifera]|uniref:Uncharacterized protein n=1 Tax=Vitis vinifera TaxID=29760 RepID=A0A438KHD0_VITVI|nr:hypothetical protein CK203_002922 [Vitis vinifera]
MVDDPLNPDKIRPGFSRPARLCPIWPMTDACTRSAELPGQPRYVLHQNLLFLERMRASRCGCSVRVGSTGGKMIVPSMGRGPSPVRPGRMELMRSRIDARSQQFLPFPPGIVFLVRWAPVDIVYDSLGGDWGPRGPRVMMLDASLPPVSERRRISCCGLMDGSVSRGLGHLKSDNPWIIGRSFSYDTDRGVMGGLSGRLGPSCLRSTGFGRSGGLACLSAFSLEARPATKTC